MTGRTNGMPAAVAMRRDLRDQLLAQYPALASDSETLCDTLAGIDDFEEQVVAVLRDAAEREAYAKALGELIEGMTARKRRFDETAKALRLVALHAMQDAGLPKLRAPDMSISVGRGRPVIVITDETLIPEAYCRIRREPNKAEIAKAIAAGITVPGVALGNPQPFLSIHRS